MWLILWDCVIRCQQFQGPVPVTSLALECDKLQMGKPTNQCPIFKWALAVTGHFCVCYIHRILGTAHFPDEPRWGRWLTRCSFLWHRLASESCLISMLLSQAMTRGFSLAIWTSVLRDTLEMLGHELLLIQSTKEIREFPHIMTRYATAVTLPKLFITGLFV